MLISDSETRSYRWERPLQNLLGPTIQFPEETPLQRPTQLSPQRKRKGTKRHRADTLTTETSTKRGKSHDNVEEDSDVEISEAEERPETPQRYGLFDDEPSTSGAGQTFGYTPEFEPDTEHSEDEFQDTEEPLEATQFVSQVEHRLDLGEVEPPPEYSEHPRSVESPKSEPKPEQKQIVPDTTPVIAFPVTATTGTMTFTAADVQDAINKAVKQAERDWQRDIANEVAGLTVKATELRIGQPSPFNGDRKQARTFWNDCEAYLLTNSRMYDTDLKQIMFILSFMKEGAAKTWKDNFVGDKQKLIKNGQAVDVAYGTKNAFRDLFEAAFYSTDVVADARFSLETFVQGKKTLEVYISNFRTLARQAEITDNNILMDYFLRGLRRDLAEKVLGAENEPATLDETVALTRKFEKHMQRADRLLKGIKLGLGQNGSGSKASAKDPNAMEVDRLSTEDRTRYKKEGRCFNCGLQGHMTKDCPKPKAQSSSSSKSTPSTKPKPGWKPSSGNQGKSKYARIRALASVFPDEDQELLNTVVNQLEGLQVEEPEDQVNDSIQTDEDEE